MLRFAVEYIHFFVVAPLETVRDFDIQNPRIQINFINREMVWTYSAWIKMSRHNFIHRTQVF